MFWKTKLTKQVDMKKFRFLMLSLIAVATLVGCGQDQGLYLPPNPKPQPTPGEGEYPLISTKPAFVTEDMTENVIVTLNTAGTSMAGFTGQLYAHTGVLTDQSATTGDWKYVKADWEENIPACCLENIDSDLWELVITGGPRAFYGVPEGETITHLAFVFRSADGKQELKDKGNDIFIELASEGMSVRIISPSHGDILKLNEECTVQVNQKDATNVKLYKNDEMVSESGSATLTYKFTPTEPEDITFKAVATNGSETLEDSVSVAVLGETVDEAMPGGVIDGVNINGNEATFVLFAPGKKSVVLLADFNEYAPKNAYMMKRSGDYFWITVPNLEEGVEYGYQYLVDGSIKIGDPYATKILDPWNDKWIDPVIYPNLKPYPSEFTSDIVSVFELNPEEYAWTATGYERPAENSLAVYELLIRDFTDEGSIDAVTAKLDYLQTLGVNAIELMPIQEFDGNDSWGYNPCFYFAADKAYGTEEAYKRFIDECHKRGIAVILDVVFNHATGQFPYAKMWWNAESNCTASDNPFFNVKATHNFSVFHDFRHLYDGTEKYFDRVLKFWLEEYKVDGFRFDLTKGLVQNPGSYDAGGYSAERIGILTGYANAIREIDEDAYVIFEHFCDQREETELYDTVGALCWNNAAMNGYMESVMGWTGNNKSSFSNFMRGRMNNIETHDEERIGYKAITYGDSYVKGDWAVISKRMQAVYAFHFLTPYPKMMWQFGELGYDFSINMNEDGQMGVNDEYRTHRKPIRWDYANDANRKAVYDAISKVLEFRNDNEEYYAQDNLSVHTWSVGDTNMGGKILVMDRVIMVANFTNGEVSTTVNVPQTGEWTNLMTGESVSLGSTHTVTLGGSDYVILVK